MPILISFGQKGSNWTVAKIIFLSDNKCFNRLLSLLNMLMICQPDHILLSDEKKQSTIFTKYANDCLTSP